MKRRRSGRSNGGARSPVVSRRGRRRRAGNGASPARVRRRPTASPRAPVVACIAAWLRGRVPIRESCMVSWVGQSGPPRGRRPAGVRTRRRARSGEGAAAGAAAGGAAAGGCPGRIRPRRCSAGRGLRGCREVKTVKNGRNGFTSRERRVRACRVIKCRVSCSSIGSGVNSEERRGEVSRRGDCGGGERRLSRAWSSSWWRSWEPRPRPSPPPRRPRPPRRRRRARRPVRSRPSS